MIKILWLILALATGVLGGALSLIHRFLLREYSDTSYGSFINLLAAVMYLPIFILSLLFAQNLVSWPHILLGSIVWIVPVWIFFKARKHTEASVYGSLGQTRLLFTLLIAYFLLSEVITLNKIFGVFLIIAGTTILTIKKGKLFGKLKEFGIQMTLLYAFLVSIANVTDKFVVGFVPPATYGLFAYLLPGLVIGMSTKKLTSLPKIFRGRLKILLLAAGMDVAAYFLALNAYQLADVGNIIPVFQISTMISVLGGIILLRERTEISKKIVGAILTIFGVIVISGLIF